MELVPVPNRQYTNISHVHTQTTLDGRSALEPMHTRHASHIQAKDSKTSENHKEPRMKRSQTTHHTHTHTKKKKLTSSAVKLSTNTHHQQHNNANNLFQNTSDQEFNTSLAKQMAHLLSLKVCAEKAEL